MNTYFSTFISGTSEIVSDLLKSKLDKVNIKVLLDGLVVFETDLPISEVTNLRFLNNVFVLVKENKDIKLINFVNEIVFDIDIQKHLKDYVSKQLRTFRVVYSKQNQITSLDKPLTQRLEGFIGLGTRLKVDKVKPDIEFWILERSERNIFFGIRITKKLDTKLVLEQGELRPELTNILCELSEPKDADVFLDPFAGSGAIPIERIAIGKYKKLFASENNKVIYQKLAQKVKSLGLNIIVGKWNATKLGALANESVDKIVTDPPWGEFDKNINIGSLYEEFLNEAHRILKKDGILIVLTSQKELIEQILIKLKGKLKLERKFDILVSGKKAGIYKLIKDIKMIE
jgi:tRNA G10  N-methylase Trm11